VASIEKFKRDHGLVWRVTWRVGEGQDRRKETKTFNTSEAAKAHKRYVEGHIEARRIGSVRKLSVFEYLDEWIAVKAVDKKNPISPKTVDGYRRNIGIFKRGLERDRPLSQLDKSHIDKAYDNLLEDGKLLQCGERGAMSKQTVLHVHRLLHKALSDAKRSKLIPDNPAADAEAPRVQGKSYKTDVRPFTKDEVLLLFARAQDPVCDPETFPMAATLAVTGLRRGELAGLADDAIDWTGCTMSVFRNVVDTDSDEVIVKGTKSEAGTAKLPIPPELVALLRTQRTRVLERALAWGKGYQRDPLFLFPGPGGAAMHPKLITRRMDRLIKRAGLVPGDGKKISPVHSWRHTTGTMLWRGFKDPKQIQGQLRQSDPQIGMALYVENTPDAANEAAHFLGGLLRDR
jgi:integrase